jgi:hypothetical protein
LAVIDATRQQKVGEIPLKAHPESFQLAAGTSHIFVNLPDTHTVAVVDRTSRRQIGSWRTGRLGGNFPMALHEDHGHVLVVFRSPPELGVFSMNDGSLVATTRVCGDADDVFVDSKRQRAYVSCGQGLVDVLDTKAAAYRRIARIPTVTGARTSLFVPTLDVLLLSVRASGREPPAIWMLRPVS